MPVSLMLSRSERLNFSETESNNCDNNMHSMIIPTCNESRNILNVLGEMVDNLVEVTTKIEVAKNCRTGGKLQ